MVNEPLITNDESRNPNPEIEALARFLRALSINRREAKRVLHDNKFLNLSGADGVDQALERIKQHPRRSEIESRAGELDRSDIPIWLLATDRNGNQYVVSTAGHFPAVIRIHDGKPTTARWIKSVPTPEQQLRILRDAASAYAEFSAH